MVGLGQRVPLARALQKYLQEKLQLEVRKPNIFNRLVGDDVVNAPVFTENVLGLRGAVRAGSAGGRIGQAAYQPVAAGNPLRPDDPRQRSRGPWPPPRLVPRDLLAHGRVFDQLSGGDGGAEIETAIKKADSSHQHVRQKTGEDADRRRTRWTKVTNEVKGVIAGKDEQLDWFC